MRIGCVTGRPRKTNPRLVRNLVRTAKTHRRTPFRELGKLVETPLSESTVRRALDDVGYHRRVAKHVPYLTKDQKKARQAWAKQQEGRGVNTRNTGEW